MGPQEPKERLEINGTLAYGQVIVMAATVIMGMDFFQECSKGFDPSGQGSFGEAVLMTHVQAKAAVRRTECRQELLMKLGSMFPHIFEEQGGLRGFGADHQWLPDRQSALPEGMVMVTVVAWVKTGVANDLDGTEHFHQVKKLVEAELG